MDTSDGSTNIYYSKNQDTSIRTAEVWREGRLRVATGFLSTIEKVFVNLLRIGRRCGPV